MNIRDKPGDFAHVRRAKIDIPIQENAVFYVLLDPGLKQGADIGGSEPATETRLGLRVRSVNEKGFLLPFSPT